MCPSCADDMQRDDMRDASRWSAYLATDERTVTTWTGGELGKVLSLTRNARQTFVRVRDGHGHQWAGVGPAESGTYVSLRRVKGD